MNKALLIIDSQVALIEAPIYQKDEFLSNVASLLERARQQECPVIYIVDDDIAEHFPTQADVHPRIAPLENEIVIHKTSTSAFFRTELDALLRSKGIQHLIIAGCKTEYCVDTTCRHAFSLGYHVTLAADGHSTTDNGILSAEQIIAHHNRNLNRLDNHEFVIHVLPTADITF